MYFFCILPSTIEKRFIYCQWQIASKHWLIEYLSTEDLQSKSNNKQFNLKDSYALLADTSYTYLEKSLPNLNKGKQQAYLRAKFEDRILNEEVLFSVYQQHICWADKKDLEHLQQLGFKNLLPLVLCINYTPQFQLLDFLKFDNFYVGKVCYGALHQANLVSQINGVNNLTDVTTHFEDYLNQLAHPGQLLAQIKQHQYASFSTQSKIVKWPFMLIILAIMLYFISWQFIILQQQQQNNILQAQIGSQFKQIMPENTPMLNPLLQIEQQRMQNLDQKLSNLQQIVQQTDLQITELDFKNGQIIVSFNKEPSEQMIQMYAFKKQNIDLNNNHQANYKYLWQTS